MDKEIFLIIFITRFALLDLKERKKRLALQSLSEIMHDLMNDIEDYDIFIKKILKDG
jgi:hypothetical protein